MKIKERKHEHDCVVISDFYLCPENEGEREFVRMMLERKTAIAICEAEDSSVIFTLIDRDKIHTEMAHVAGVVYEPTQRGRKLH